MTRLVLLTLTVLVLARGVSAADPDPLQAYRWTSRLLVVAAPSPTDPRLKAQRQALASASAGAAERDLIVIEAIGRDSKAVAIRRRLRVPDESFRAVLIGKDGDAKLESDEPIPTQRLFSTIDAMPMRQNETKGRR